MVLKIVNGVHASFVCFCVDYDEWPPPSEWCCQECFLCNFASTKQLRFLSQESLPEPGTEFLSTLALTCILDPYLGASLVQHAAMEWSETHGELTPVLLPTVDSDDSEPELDFT